MSASRKKLIGITGLGMFVPSRVLTNHDIERMVDTSDEWITTRTGIKQRRIAEPGTPSSALAVKAARKALRQADLAPQDVELIIVATLTPDMLMPSTACFVQGKLGARKAICFDLNAACTGFLYGLVTAENYIATGMCRNALVIGAEVMSSFLDWTDRNTCPLFGDGAGAAVLRPVRSGGILASHLGCDGTLAEELCIPAGGSRHPASEQTVAKRMHTVKMNGNEVFKSAVRLMTEAARQAMRKAKVGCPDIARVIPHQANLRIIDSVRERMGLPEEKVFLNVAKYGNVSAASTAIALCEAVRFGKVVKGDTIVLVAFGAGFTWGSVVIRW